MARMDTDYEYNDVGNATKSPTIVKKGGWLGKIVALLLGLVIGLVAGLGGLVGAGFYIVTQMKIKDATNTVGSLAGIEIPLSDYLSDEYAEMTLLGLFNGTAQTLTNIGNGTGTLGDLNKISPFVGTFIKKEGGLVDMLASFGIQTTAEELMNKFVVKTVATEGRDDRYLTDFLLLKMNDVPFAQFIQTLGFSGNEMITILCYGVEGVDYKIENGEYVMLGDSKALTVGDFMGEELDNRIKKLPLDSIMGTPEDDIMRLLFYGTSNRYTQTERGDIVMNQVFYTYDGTNFYDENGDKLDLESDAPVPGIENCYLLTFKDGTKQIVILGENNKYYAYTTSGATINQGFCDGENFYDENGDKLDLENVTPIPGSENCYLLTFKDGTKQLVKLSSDNTYLAFTTREVCYQKTTIKNLPDAINSLTIDDVFGDHFTYRTYNPTTGVYTSYFENGNHQPIDADGNLIEDAYLIDINNDPVDDGDGIITREEADKALTGTWKYLLMDRKEDGTFEIDHHHTLTEMEQMMEYMSNNVQAATVRELKLDGIVKNLDDDTLDKVIVGEVPTGNLIEIDGELKPEIKEVMINGVRADELDGEPLDEDHVGDLSIEQLMLYMAAMLDIVS